MKALCKNIFCSVSLRNEGSNFTLCVGIGGRTPGEIATSITYIHVAIPLILTNIWSLDKQIGATLSLTTEPRMHFHKNNNDDHYKKTYWDDNYIWLLECEKYGL